MNKRRRGRPVGDKYWRIDYHILTVANLVAQQENLSPTAAIRRAVDEAIKVVPTERIGISRDQIVRRVLDRLRSRRITSKGKTIGKSASSLAAVFPALSGVTGGFGIPVKPR